MHEMMGGYGGTLIMLLWWLIGLGVLFFVVYEGVYHGVKRALREERDAPPGAESDTQA